MKNFKLLLEDIQGLLLEANFKPLYTKLQKDFLKLQPDLGNDYSKLTPAVKESLQKFIRREIELIENDVFKKIPNITENEKQWIINIFATEQQDYYSDKEKIIEQMNEFLELKRRDKLSKEDKNLNKLSYDDFYKLLKKYQSMKEDERDFGNNEIIHEDGDWKVIKFTVYDDMLPYIDGSKSNWCVKYKHRFDTYQPPFYGFFLKNKPFALFHQDTVQLKDVDDKEFLISNVKEDFETKFKWLIDSYLKFKKTKKFHEVGDLYWSLTKNYKFYKKYFTSGALIDAFYQQYEEGSMDLKHYAELTKDLFEDVKKHGQSLNFDILRDLLHMDYKYYKKFLSANDFLDTILKLGITDQIKKMSSSNFGNSESDKEIIEDFKDIIDSSEFDINEAPHNGVPLLHRLCRMKNYKLLEILFKSDNAKHIDFTDERQYTYYPVIQEAIMSNDIKILQIVMKYGIKLGMDVNQRLAQTTKPYSSYQTLFQAIETANDKSNPELLKTFISNPEVIIDYTKIFSNIFEDIIKCLPELEILFQHKKPENPIKMINYRHESISVMEKIIEEIDFYTRLDKRGGLTHAPQQLQKLRDTFKVLNKYGVTE